MIDRKSIIVSLCICLGFFYALSPANALSVAQVKRQILKLKQQLEKSPDNKKMQTKLGILHYKIKDFKGALFYFNSAKNDKDPNSFLNIAKVYRAQKKYLDEIRILNLMIPKHPNYPRGYILLADALVELKKYDEAIVKYRKAIDINPKYEAAHWGLFKVYEKKENNYESRIILHDLIKHFGQKSKYFNPLCRLYSVDSYFEDSIAYCQQAIQLDPKYADNHIYLALTYKYSKNILQAEKIIKTAAKQFPKSKFAQQTAGEIMLERENWERASQYFTRCTKIESKNLDCHLGLAKSAFKIGKYKVSNNAYLAACKLDRKTITEYKKSAAILRINKKTDWFNKFTKSIGKCY